MLLRNVCVEMMIDTGAEISVISNDLATELNLSNQISRQEQGIASSVGKAQIIGKIHKVICSLGDVDFYKVKDENNNILPRQRYYYELNLVKRDDN